MEMISFFVIGTILILSVGLYSIFKKKENPSVYSRHNLCEEDVNMLMMFDDCKAFGKIVLPSGFVIPDPPEGCCWYLNKGYASLMEK